MRAVRCEAYGPPDGVVVRDVPAPHASPGQVVVDVAAASVNFPDVLLCTDRYQVSIPVPFTPGSEFSGVVAAVGEQVHGLGPGDRVFGSSAIGAFAEQVVVPAPALTRLPMGVDLREAAAFGVAYSTAYHSLRSVAAVQPGEWVAVSGAAGGVGLAAVDLARVLGASVLAAASSDEKLAVCRSRGAAATVNYSTEDLKVQAKELTSGGIDVVIDPVGGACSEPLLRATRRGGRFVCVGFASGEIPRIPLNLVLLKGVTVQGFEFRSFVEHEPETVRRGGAELLDLFASGRVRPYVSDVYPLDAAGAALRAMAERRVVGKVVVEMTDGR